MDLVEAIQRRESVREYTDQGVSHTTLERLLISAHRAPSSCNLQLTEYIIVDDQDMLTRLAQRVTPKFLWAPMFIVFVYDARFTVKRHAATVSLGAAMEHIALQAVEEGLATCPMAGFKDDDFLRKQLGIPKHYTVGLIMAVGYPAKPEQHKKDNRVPLSQIMHWGSYAHTDNQLQTSPHLKDWTPEQIIAYRKRMAPVYMYGDWYRLHTFPREVYKRAYEILEKYVQHDGAFVDLVTYDGTFIRTVMERLSSVTVTATDFFSYPMDVLAAQYAHLDTAYIDKDAHIDLPDASQDAVTMVHKFAFTHNSDALFAEANRILKPGGALFVTTHTMSLRERLRRWWRLCKKRYIDRELVNVYENSPYYKIGPVKYVRPKEIDEHAFRAGFVKEQEGRDKQWKFAWRLYVKR